MLYLIIGCLNKVSRDLQNTNDLCRSNFESHKCNEFSNKTVIGMLSAIQKDMKQFSFHMRMDTVDVSEFFPLESNAQLQRFLDRSHEEWPLRRRGFYHLLFTTVTKEPKRFASALLHTLFTRTFIHEHKWQYNG